MTAFRQTEWQQTHGLNGRSEDIAQEHVEHIVLLEHHKEQEVESDVQHHKQQFECRKDHRSLLVP